MRNNSQRNGKTVAGVRLYNNTANTKQSERWVKWLQNLRIFGNHENEGTVRRRSCGWSYATTDTQQRSEGWDKKTTIPSNFRIQSRKRGEYHGDTVAGAALQQRHRSTKLEKKPSWNVCSNRARQWCDDVELALGCVWDQNRQDYQL